ncbi:hypothetical protein Prum_063910 [Phytohabitans rumicis]|uniref:Flavin reductase like domain-containing protein n=2 Tax=Phytohabitans rumicis TaxID=1076125 RepID=A0A6V8LDU0_9ACTN|nr:hypothetical protein Prum_063910 [Phytohabitans rumicis]
MTRRSSSPELLAEAARFRDLMAGWPTGVAVVTGTAAGHPVGCTVTAVASVSADPPLLLVSLAARSRTLEAIEHAGQFGICVLSAAQRRLAQTFATGEPARRFAGVPFRWVLGVPVLHGAMTVAVCAVQEALPVADHVIVMGGPLWQAEDHAAAPFIWFRRGYWDLCPAGPPPGVLDGPKSTLNRIRFTLKHNDFRGRHGHHAHHRKVPPRSRSAPRRGVGPHRTDRSEAPPWPLAQRQQPHLGNLHSGTR